MSWSAIGKALTLVWAITWLAAAGCSSRSPQTEEPAVVNLRTIVQAYDVAEYRLRRPPRNEDELKRFFGEVSAAATANEVLRSPRDGQPYVIRYGLRLDPDGRNVVLAHEK